MRRVWERERDVYRAHLFRRPCAVKNKGYRNEIVTSAMMTSHAHACVGNPHTTPYLGITNFVKYVVLNIALVNNWKNLQCLISITYNGSRANNR